MFSGVLKKGVNKNLTTRYVTCVRTKEDVERAFNSAHIEDTSHGGANRTIDRITQNWFWNGMADYAREKVCFSSYVFLFKDTFI